MNKVEKKERQYFIDEVAKGIFINDMVIRQASQAYRRAEALWEERQDRIRKETK